MIQAAGHRGAILEPCRLSCGTSGPSFSGAGYGCSMRSGGSWSISLGRRCHGTGRGIGGGGVSEYGAYWTPAHESDSSALSGGAWFSSEAAPEFRKRAWRLGWVPDTFKVYIDESGDEGLSFRVGSSEWFVISAVVVRTSIEMETVKLVDDVRVLLNKPPKKPLHFRDLKHHHRVPFVERIASADLRAISILVHKPSLLEPEKFRERYRLYFYSVRYLLERVSWYCRDHAGPKDSSGGNGAAQLIFSNRSGMSYAELCEYLRLLKAGAPHNGVTIHWPSIDPANVIALSSGKRMGLQLADAVASSFFYAVETNQYGNTEDKYVKILHPVVYRYGPKYLGYGVKLWPKEVATQVGIKKELAWILEAYR